MQLQTPASRLPIAACKSELVAAVQEHLITIIVGETGSGKTTQLPQYLYECGFGRKEKSRIGITQPRRVAAMQMAKRVAQEMKSPLGGLVGYHVRFDDKTSADTRIKFVTDGMLQRELIVDPLLQQYDCIVLDEVHERTVATDVLLGVLRSLASRQIKSSQDDANERKQRRQPLRLVIMSATLNAKALSSYFHHAPVYYVPGRQYPVKIYYAPTPVHDYLDAAISTLLQIHLVKPMLPNTASRGHILCFLTGEEEILLMRQQLLSIEASLPPKAPKYVVCPFFAAQSEAAQKSVFEPLPPGSQTRKIILATNIAETSLTIPGVQYVVDTGKTKITTYHALSGVTSLDVKTCSKTQARQRLGRAGREAAGECYRLWTEEAWQSSWQEEAEPELARSDVSSVLLLLKAAGIHHHRQFPWLNPLPTEKVQRAEASLVALGAFERRLKQKDGVAIESFKLTALGRALTQFPVSPKLAKFLLDAAKAGCALEAVCLVACLESEPLLKSSSASSTRESDVLHVSREEQKREERGIGHGFETAWGDHIFCLHVLRQFAALFPADFYRPVEEAQEQGKNKARRVSKRAQQWCNDHNIKARSLQTVLDTIHQLAERMVSSADLQPLLKPADALGGPLLPLSSHLFSHKVFLERREAAGALSHDEGDAAYEVLLSVMLQSFSSQLAFRARLGPFTLLQSSSDEKHQGEITSAALWPGSCLTQASLQAQAQQEADQMRLDKARQPESPNVGTWLLYTDLIKSADKVYLRNVSRIPEKLIPEALIRQVQYLQLPAQQKRKSTVSPSSNAKKAYVPTASTLAAMTVRGADPLGVPKAARASTDRRNQMIDD